MLFGDEATVKEAHQMMVRRQSLRPSTRAPSLVDRHELLAAHTQALLARLEAEKEHRMEHRQAEAAEAETAA